MNQNIFFEIVIYISSILIPCSTFIFLYMGLKYRRESISVIDLNNITLSKAHPDSYVTIETMINNRIFLSSTKLIRGSELLNSPADFGIGNIEFLLSKIIDVKKNVHLHCLNKGGALIATYLAHRLGLDNKYLVKCDYNKKTNKIYCENRADPNTIILIDDVARTGETISKVKNYLKQQYPDVPIFCFVLVDASNNGEENSELVDYAPYITNNKNITFQWSPWSKVDMKPIQPKHLGKSLEKNIQFFEEAKNKCVEYFNDTEMDQIVDRIKCLEAKISQKAAI
jgi:hypoxanthine phosphoribosyltransferase